MRRTPRPLACALACLLSLASGPALGATTEQAPKSTPDPWLEALQAEAERYPQDYGAAVRLAEAAAAAGEQEMALSAWDRALDLSGGAPQARLGRALALLALGRIAEARAEARLATEQAPEDARTWDRLAWTLRHPLPGGPGVWGLAAAGRAYRRSLAIDPEGEVARCGAAWTELARGLRLPARRSFQALAGAAQTHACGEAGQTASGPHLLVGGDTTVSVLVHQDDPDRNAGIALVARAGIELDELLFLQLIGRILAQDPGQAEEAGTEGSMTQQELWGRAGLNHGDLGFQVLVGSALTTHSDQGRLFLGAQGWAGAGLTVRGEGAYGLYPGAETFMAGLGVRVPVAAWITLDGQLRLSSLLPDASALPAAGPGAPAPTVELDGPYPSGALTAQLELGRLSLQVGGHVGQEPRPLRFETPTLWNILDPVWAGAEIGAHLDLPAPGLGLGLSYQVIRSQPRGSSSAFHTHVLSLGISAVLERGP